MRRKKRGIGYNKIGFRRKNFYYLETLIKRIFAFFARFISLSVAVSVRNKADVAIIATRADFIYSRGHFLLFLFSCFKIEIQTLRS